MELITPDRIYPKWLKLPYLHLSAVWWSKKWKTLSSSFPVPTSRKQFYLLCMKTKYLWCSPNIEKHFERRKEIGSIIHPHICYWVISYEFCWWVWGTFDIFITLTVFFIFLFIGPCHVSAPASAESVSNIFYYFNNMSTFDKRKENKSMRKW